MNPPTLGTTASVSPVHIAERVAETIDRLFTTIDEWRDLLQAHLAADHAPNAATLDPLVEAFAVPALAADGLVTGAGFVAAPGVLSDAHWHLAWWLGGGDGIRRLATVDDPASDQFRDYTALEWWRVPVQTGAQHITGPYVDYLCTDEYTLTLTAPVYNDGSLIGVVGADLYVDDIESVLLPRLYELGTPTTLVNASARIVASTDSHRATGSLLRSDGLAAALGASAAATATAERTVLLPEGERVVACGDTSLSLVIGPS